MKKGRLDAFPVVRAMESRVQLRLYIILYTNKYHALVLVVFSCILMYFNLSSQSHFVVQVLFEYAFGMCWLEEMATLSPADGQL